MSKTISLIILSFILSVLLICTSFRNKDVNEISKLIISRNYPSIQSDGKIKYTENNLNVYYCNEYEVYQYPSDQSFFTFNGKGETINDSNRVTTEYFICKKKQKSGIVYSKSKSDEIDLLKKSVVKTDSIVHRILVSSLDLDSSNLVLVESKSVSLGIIEEKYVPKLKLLNSIVIADTISFFFSKDMMEFDYSFSKKTDSLKRSKFIGYKARFLSKYYGTHPIKIDEIQLNLEMKKVPVDNKEFILSLIERFKKDKHILN